MNNFETRIAHSVEEVGQARWDQLSARRPFTSFRWYRFGEAVMSDCIPVYIILSQNGEDVARGTFWVIRNEPLPIPWAPVRGLMHSVFRCWPLFVCRSPLANLSGLILPEAPLRHLALEALIVAASEEARKYRVSFLLFDFLEEEAARWIDWPTSFASYEDPDPGTCMAIVWAGFDQYLNSLSPKIRKHYRRYLREAERLGLQFRWQDLLGEDEQKEALDLIRDVERRHRSTPSPWTGAILEKISMIGGAWLAARIGDRLVACELVLEDNGVQLVTALGLVPEISHAYFLLGYADIQRAIETGTRLLRWGSGAYDSKHRYGFLPERNNYIAFTGLGPIPRLIAKLAARK